MPEFQNIKQKIEYYQGLTGIYTAPEPFMNDQQYCDYLQNICDKPKPQPKPEPKPVVNTTTKKKKGRR